MPRRILDPKLLLKVANKLGKNNIVDVNVLVSKRASKLGISPEAALVIISKELSIGTASYQRKLDQNKQAEIRDTVLVRHRELNSNGPDTIKMRRYINVNASKKEKIFKLEPELYGMGINLRVLWNWIFKKSE